MNITHALRTLPDAAPPPPRKPGLQGMLGEPAWGRLPAAVRERFGEPPRTVDYAGVLEVVRASLLGRLLAGICRLIGTPVVPRTGRQVPAIVRVGPAGGGVCWTRDYCWPDAPVSRVCSTKVITPRGVLVEKLPAGLCMELVVREQAGALHFISRRYYFELQLAPFTQSLKLPLPGWLSPGTVHVIHADEAGGWFRFTMTVTHPVWGELFHQTGRFHVGRLTCPPPLS